MTAPAPAPARRRRTLALTLGAMGLGAIGLDLADAAGLVEHLGVRVPYAAFGAALLVAAQQLARRAPKVAGAPVVDSLAPPVEEPVAPRGRAATRSQHAGGDLRWAAHVQGREPGAGHLAGRRRCGASSASRSPRSSVQAPA